MKKITNLLLLMMFMSSMVLMGQTAAFNTNSDEEAQMRQQRRAPSLNAQTQAVPSHKLEAKSSTTFTVPNKGSRAISNIKIEVTADYWIGESSYNLWSYTDGAYYWATDQTFATSYETITHILPLTEGDDYSVDCLDSYGDGGISGVVSNDDTGWFIMDWMSNDYGAFGEFNFTAWEGYGPPVYLPITAFPFEADWEDGVLSGDEFVQPMTDVQSGAYLSANAANASAFGFMMEGGASSTGWSGGGTSTTYDNAFVDNVTHQSELLMEIHPDLADPGYLFMTFDMRQNYSFGFAYEWFRVLVDGVPVADINGDTFWNPTTDGADPWQNLTFDLTAFKNLASFEVTLQNSAKYYYGYSTDGDVAMIDNLGMFYSVPGLEIVNNALDMGDRPIGAWMQPASYELVNNPGIGDISITQADIDDNFGGFLAVTTPALPFALASGETTYEFGIGATEEVVADGAFAGNFAVFFGGARAITHATYSGNAYTPDAGDVWELAFDGNAAAYPVNVPMGTFRDNYDMPGADADGWDVVYMFTFGTDVVFNAGLTATDAKMALYPVGFEGVGGPDMDNELFNGTTALVDIELTEGTYYMAVSTTGADYDLDVTFPDMPLPEAATYVAPFDGETGVINGDDLVWLFGDYTVEYQVILGTTYPPTTVVVPWTSNLAETYTLVNTQPNLQYFWMINTRNTTGQTPVIEVPIWGFTAAITPPSGLVVTLDDPGESSPTVSTSLTWDAPLMRAFLGYNVYRDGVKLNTDLLTTETYADLGLARDMSYTYYVTSVFDQGESGPSNEVTVSARGVGTFDGVVTDALTTLPIENASVNIFGDDYTYSLPTNALGEYSTLAYTDTYEIAVSAEAYGTQTVGPIVLTHGATETNNFALTETPLPVGFVTAEEINADEVHVSWTNAAPVPVAAWLAHDDGVNYGGVGAGGTGFSAVSRWTPALLVDYVGTSLTKMNLFVASGVVNAEIELNVWTGTTPPTLVYTQAVTGLVYDAWNEITLDTPFPITGAEELWFGYTIADGYDGYPAGRDNTPAIDGFGNKIFYGGVWYDLSDFSIAGNWNVQGFVTDAVTNMSRPLASVEGAYFNNMRPVSPTSKVEDSDVVNTSPSASLPAYADGNTRGIVSYDVYRNKVYQPETAILVGNTIQMDFIDFEWGIQDWGVYQWSVVVNYDAGQMSDPTYSNTLETDMEILVSAMVNTNSGDSPLGTMVAFTNTSELDEFGEPIYIFSAMLDDAGFKSWADFRRGTYDIEVVLPGFTPIDLTGIDIFEDEDFEWMLEEIISTPGDLYVTPTGWATWVGNTGDNPFEPFIETFDGLATDELPDGWTAEGPTTENWGADATSDNAGGTAPEMEFYYYPYDIGEYYLKTPMLNTDGQETLEFAFKQYLSHYNSVTYPYTIRVVAIADGVEYLIEEWAPTANITASDWNYTLTDAHGVGAEEFQLAWVIDGAVYGMNYWNIDNVVLNGPARNKASRAFEVYKVYHDGTLITEVIDTEYQYGTEGEVLVAGETYTAGVAAVFTMGQSATAEFDWIYVPCDDYDAPTAFTAAQDEGTLNITLDWTNVDAAALDTIAGVAVYRDGDLYDFIDFETAITNTYTDGPLDFGTYSYCITYIYDSGAETCQGVVCSGDVELTGNATVDGFVFQDAYLGGAPIEGAEVYLVDVDDPTMEFFYFADTLGAYGGEIIAGTYDYTVSAWGYMTETLDGVVIPENGTVSNTFELDEFPAPPVNVVATELNDDEVLLTWNNPQFSMFEPYVADMGTGVPAGWTIDPAAMPTWFWTESDAGNQLGGKAFMFVDSDAAGTVDMDVTMTTPVIEYTMGQPLLLLNFDQYYNYFSGDFADVEVYDGNDWVVVLHQTSDQGGWTSPSHKSIDVTAYANPEFQVRFRYVANWDWYWAVNNVVVTNAVTRTGEPILASRPITTRAMTGYEIYRTTCVTGDLTFMGMVPATDSVFTDHTWGAAEPGVYKWGVVAVYETNDSEIAFSNCLDKNMMTDVTVTVATNSGDSPAGTFVEFTNMSEPELGLIYVAILDETGYYAWDDFRLGDYDIHVEKAGFAAIDIVGEPIWEPTDFVWLLEEEITPVGDLHVNPNGFATWTGTAGPPPPPPIPVVFEDNFDTYNAGEQLACQNPVGWTTWSNLPCSSEDAYVSDAFAYSGSNSVVIVENEDLVKNLDTYLTSGAYSSRMMVYVPTGFDGYYNAMTDFDVAYEWGFEIYFNLDGSGSVNGGGTGAATFTYAHDTWMMAQLDIDLDNDWAEFYLDGTLLHGWTWTLGAAGGGAQLQLAAFDFFGATATTQMYFDDFIIEGPLNTTASRSLEYYKVWLDGIFVENVMDNFYQYDVTTLVQGQEYYSEVAAMYTNGMSERMDYYWTYMPCDSFPGPANLAGEVQDVNNVFLTWGGTPVPPPPPVIIIIDENYDDYTAGGKLAEQAQAMGRMYWTTWSGAVGGTEDATVSDAQSVSGSNSMLIEQDVDAVLLFDAYTAGVFNVDFDVYIPAGKLGYFNLLQAFDGAASSWGTQTYFNAGGAGLTDAGGAGTGVFTYTYDTWHHVTTMVDLDADYAEMYFNGDFIVSWVWSGGAFGTNTLNQFESMDFYGAAADDGTLFDNMLITMEPDKSAYTSLYGSVISIGDKGEGYLNSLPAGSESRQLGLGTRALLFNNGPLVNSAGTGAGGADESILMDGLSTYGYGVSINSGYSLADDFTVDQDWTVETFTFYAYQTGSSTSSSLTEGYFQIYDGKPGDGGTVIYGDLTTNRMINTTWTNIYRNNDGPGGSTNRPIMEYVCDASGLTLTPGAYWVEFTVAGSLSSGPWAPPVTISGQPITGNAMQNTGGWAEIDGQGMPFLINGTSGGGGGGGYDPGPVIGANVYRDGVLIAEMVQDTFYLDLALNYGIYEYCVNLLYTDLAESCTGSCIDVEVTEDCVAPEDLIAELEGDNLVHLLWDTYVPPTGEWIIYNDGTFENGLCSTAGGAGLAQVFTPIEYPCTVTEVRYFNDAYGSPANENNIYVLTGDGATVLAGPYSVSGEAGDTWVTVDVDDVTLESGTFMVYTENAAPDGPFVGVDDSFYDGSLFFGSPGAFTELGVYGYYYVGSHEAFVLYGELTANAVSNSTLLRPANATNNSSALAVSNHVSNFVASPDNNQSRSFVGYNIYKNGDLLEALWPDNYYDYMEMQIGYHCYTVTAEYSYCGESAHSNEACVDVTVGIDEIGENEVSLYPNPASNRVNVTSIHEMTRLTVTNYVGQIVYTEDVSTTRVELNTNSYQAGVYLVKIETESGVVTKRVIIRR